MLIPQQISIITVLILAHCTLIVWSVSLTRSVSSEPTSPNVNKSYKFVTLVDSHAENTDLSQTTEVRTFSSSLIVTPKSPKNTNSSIPDNYNKTEWPRTDKVEPRFFPCLFCIKYDTQALPWSLIYLVFHQIVKARNTVIESISTPLIWSTDKFFTGLETMHKVRVNITRRMVKTKCKLNSNCEIDSS